MSGTDYSKTPNLALFKPFSGLDVGSWGSHTNNNWDTLDKLFPNGGTSTFLPLSGGIMTGPLTVTATGANTARSVQDRFRDLINVLDYGAKGDGTTDDTSAIQAALTAGGGKYPVWIPNTGSNYIISGTFSLPSNTHLIIAGTLFLANGANCNMFSTTGGNYFLIEGGGTLNGNRANQGPNTGGGQFSGGIQFINANNITIRDLTINEFYNWPVNIATCNVVVLDNLNISGSNSSVEFAAQSFNCWASRLRINNINDEAFAFYGGCYNCGIVNSIITGGTADGISVLNDNAQKQLCHHILISGNVVTGAGISGISIAQGSGGVGNHHDIIIADNLLYGNNQTNNNSRGGIFNQYGDRVSMLGNTIHSDGVGTNSSFGVYLGPGTSYNKLIGNTIYNEGQGGTSTGTGIYNDSAAHSLIVGNHIYDNQGTPTQVRAIGGNAGAYMQIYCNSFYVSTNQMVSASDTLIIFRLNTNTLNLGQNVQINAGFISSGVNAALVLGATTGAVAGQPYIDFHPSGHAGQDVRLQASGGTGNADGALTMTGLQLNCPQLKITTGGVGFYNTNPVITKPTVTGAKGSNAALGSLLTALAGFGLLTDSTTA
jgi:hypothetical protein